MGVRLDALPDYLATWHVPFTLLDGWRIRARRSGDFADLLGIGVHHTASSVTPERDLGWMYVNSPDKPIGNGLLDRSGHFTLAAVRATNTQGRGGPYLTTRGVIPADSGNSRMFSIEAANNGVGEPWPAPMIDTYIKLCAALVECISDTTPGARLQVGDIIAHFEWAPGRKYDPAGNSPYAAGGALWDMDAFRRDVYVALNPPLPPVPDQEDEPMYLATLAGGDIVVVGSAVRPVSLDELNGPFAALPRFTPKPSSNWHAWLRAAADEYASRVGMA